jgi:glycosyltransferase involved in cell wall biosynthesis
VARLTQHDRNRGDDPAHPPFYAHGGGIYHAPAPLKHSNLAAARAAPIDTPHAAAYRAAPSGMRVVIASTGALSRELGTGQVHGSLADGLRALGHDVHIWTPTLLTPGHWTVGPFRLREQWREYVRTLGGVDVVDSPPILASARDGHSARWVCRSTQPDILYTLETARDQRASSFVGVARATMLVGLAAALAATFYEAWTVSDVIMCHTRSECRRVARACPWIRAPMATWDGALSDADRAALDAVRRARQPRPAGSPTRYLWVGRWVAAKGTRRLLEFLAERLAETRDEFTVAGCGEAGVEALARLTHWPRLRVVPSFTRAELPALLARHDAGLFTSEAEGWGLVLNEMIEAGMPVYATDAGGVEALRAILPESLPAFPPPIGAELPPPPPDDAYRRYHERFSWKAVTARYLEALAL